MTVNQKYKDITVWGLSRTRHSHRFIHKGFYENLSQVYENVKWLEDTKGNQYDLKPGGLVLASGVAARNLPIIQSGNYVLHNVELTKQQDVMLKELGAKVLRLQVFTKDATGKDMWNLPYVKFDVENQTLYQPWGVPVDKVNWLPPIDSRKNEIEYWVGAIWNNPQNQGNREILKEYREYLSSRKIKFQRVGGSRLFLNGLSDAAASNKIRKSPIGATIVGNWQRENQYIPCRLFKNIAAGVSPITNLNAMNLLGESAIYSTDLENLIELALAEQASCKIERLHAAQKSISQFTYKLALKRIFDALEFIN